MATSSNRKTASKAFVVEKGRHYAGVDAATVKAATVKAAFKRQEKNRKPYSEAPILDKKTLLMGSSNEPYSGKKGILIVGPQGSGKTQIAEAIAAKFKPNKVARLDSFKDIRNVFAEKLYIMDGVHDLPPLSQLRQSYCRFVHPDKWVITSPNEAIEIPKEYADRFTIIRLPGNPRITEAPANPSSQEMNINREIYKELKRAETKHPNWPTDPLYKASIVMEEAGEVIRAANQLVMENGHIEDLRTELIQTAAVAIRMLKTL